MKTAEAKTKTNSSNETKTTSVFNPTAEESFFKGNQPGFFGGFPVQAKLKVGAPNDSYEREADVMADKVMRMPEPTVQRSCSSCSGKKREDELYRKPLVDTISRTSAVSSSDRNVSPGIESAIRSGAGNGQSLPESTRSFMESRFGTDFSGINIHTDSHAQQLNSQLGARAFTYGNDIFFNRDEYNPDSRDGKHLLAHELTHTVQQNSLVFRQVQRTIGDGHDLTSPRFSKIQDLEDVYDGICVLQEGDSGRGVQAVQIALYDLGFSLPIYGASGDFGEETKNAVMAYQKKNSISADGIVNSKTMKALDSRFEKPVLPSSKELSAPWTPECVLSVLCSWSPHTVDTLSKIKVWRFDKIIHIYKVWDGKEWEKKEFYPEGLSSQNIIYILNSFSCEKMALTLYHEVIHENQPLTHKTALDDELYAYKMEEEFGIAMGLSDSDMLRSRDAQGREFADEEKIKTYVYKNDPRLMQNDEIGEVGEVESPIRKKMENVEVEIRKLDGSIEVRKLRKGDKMFYDEKLKGGKKIKTKVWKCEADKERVN